MSMFQGRSTTKPSGGKLKTLRSKRRFEIGREPTLTRVGETQRKTSRTFGGNAKVILLKAQTANVYNPKSKVSKHVKIITVKQNPANPHYVQRNIMGKGSIIQTELGEARITSRPGQDGIVNAILL
ncbi:MAG: 30S ribosomal protein S8e [Thermoplasmataceae archaeon]